MQQKLADSTNHSIYFIFNIAIKHFQQIEGLKFTLDEVTKKLSN